MSISKAWAWGKERHPIWLTPSEESHYIARRWQEKNYKSLLDFGCGLGRHSIFFAKQGFDVSAFDLSAEGADHLNAWAAREGLNINIAVADMLALPYPDSIFDCLYAFHVISHTDTAGMRSILQSIRRILRPQGEAYITLCSKSSWSFNESGFPKLDANTIIKTTEGPEQGVPHFYTDMDGIIELFGEAGLRLERVRRTDDCYWDGEKRSGEHYFVLAERG